MTTAAECWAVTLRQNTQKRESERLERYTYKYIYRER